MRSSHLYVALFCPVVRLYVYEIWGCCGGV
jgi:hypothetical protein